MRKIIYIIILLASSLNLFSQGDYLLIRPKAGDGIYTILKRYELPPGQSYITKFKELNAGRFTRSGGIILSNHYYIPVRLYKYNGTSIRSTIGISDYNLAKSIQDWNLLLYKKGVKPGDYRVDKELWVPVYYAQGLDGIKEPVLEELNWPIFGPKYAKFKQKDHLLKDRVYYIVSGHGGPDPGAVGFKNGYELHEEEYAYDVSLRLARRLLERGATVYIIVQDPDDGIRDDKYLNIGYNEYYFGGDTISIYQKERLRKRAEIINGLYHKHSNTALSQQVIVNHVDSRYINKRIDIFFYYAPGSKEGKGLAHILYNTIKQKYNAAQPGRGYEGTVTERNLYMLRHTLPVCVYIELGNIQNPEDQVRFIEKNNRQAIANWLCDGLIESTKTE
ncbi:MAG: N-acetylmuramoyl-L-alanine amidase [Candidatus Kapaibacterium sp.]